VLLVTAFWLVVALAWGMACFGAGYAAARSDDVSRLLERLGYEPPDEPPEKVRT
jgi:hypothetical protein